MAVEPGPSVSFDHTVTWPTRLRAANEQVAYWQAEAAAEHAWADSESRRLQWTRNELQKLWDNWLRGGLVILGSDLERIIAGPPEDGGT